MSDSEWIFDYVLQILESDYFDAVIMDFVDENCIVFDSEEENKFIYTDLHNQFKDHVESLMTQSLKDLDVSNEIFYEALEKGRNARDINRTVYEKLLAMEDFEHFKKIMVKRNIELQLEELQEYRALQGGDLVDKPSATLPDPDELEQRILTDISRMADTDTDDMAAIVKASLLEMELIHKQEEMERMELEQALALSLLVEEERLEMAREEAKQSASTEMEDKNFYRDDFKDSAVTGAKNEADASPMVSRSKPANVEAAPVSSTKASSKEEAGSVPTSVSSAMSDLNVSEPKFSAPRSLKALNPIGSKMGSPSRALPPINSGGMDAGGGSWVLDSQVSGLEERKRRAEEAFRKNQDQLAEQRRAEEEAKRRLLNAVSDSDKQGSSDSSGPSAEDERARNMREQRERLIAKKKREREEKVRQEQELKEKKSNDEKASGLAKSKDPNMSRFIEEQRKAGHGDAEEAARREAEEAERKRAQVRRAMAMHMKRDLIESEEAKYRDEEMAQFSELDRKLKKVENLYAASSQRNALIGEQMRNQEVHLANSKKAASQLRGFS